MKANPGSPLTVSELATHCQVPTERLPYFRNVLHRMDVAGLIERVGAGRYRWPVQEA
jgi:predicted transcriptional regulator of viral defense system